MIRDVLFTHPPLPADRTTWTAEQTRIMAACSSQGWRPTDVGASCMGRLDEAVIAGLATIIPGTVVIGTWELRRPPGPALDPEAPAEPVTPRARIGAWDKARYVQAQPLVAQGEDLVPSAEPIQGPTWVGQGHRDLSDVTVRKMRPRR